MQPIITFLLIQLVLSSTALASPVEAAPLSPAPKQKLLTFSGTFLMKTKSSTRGYPSQVVVQPTFLCQRSGDGRLKFLVFNQCGGMHNDHLAALESTVALKNGRARFKQGAYLLNIQFLPGKVVLTESGDPMDCGFGQGAGLAGEYLLKSSAPPAFSKAEQEHEIEEQESE